MGGYVEGRGAGPWAVAVVASFIKSMFVIVIFAQVTAQLSTDSAEVSSHPSCLSHSVSAMAGLIVCLVQSQSLSVGVVPGRHHGKTYRKLSISSGTSTYNACVLKIVESITSPSIQHI